MLRLGQAATLLSVARSTIAVLAHALLADCTPFVRALKITALADLLGGASLFKN